MCSRRAGVMAMEPQMRSTFRCCRPAWMPAQSTCTRTGSRPMRVASARAMSASKPTSTPSSSVVENGWKAPDMASRRGGRGSLA